MRGKIVVPLFFEHKQMKSSVTLRRGYYFNGGEVTSSLRCGRCRTGPPKLVSVHHVDSTFCLYGCDRCRDYLIKVKVDKVRKD